MSLSDLHHFDYTLTTSPHSQPPNTPVPIRLAYKTLGAPPSATHQPKCIVIPTCFGGTVDTELAFLHAGATAVFNAKEHFLLKIGQFYGAQSTSPSNAAAAPAPSNSNGYSTSFPKLSYLDDVAAQHALCAHLNIAHLTAYIGFSMGGQQAYHLAVQYPDFADNIVCIATSARTSAWNWCFLEGPKAALHASLLSPFADPAVNGGYSKAGCAAFGRVYAPWALSPAWFKQRCWETKGYGSLEAYLAECWAGPDALGGWDARDLLGMAGKWQEGDVGKCGAGKGLEGVKARMLVLPVDTDQYFRVEDSAEEVKALQAAGKDAQLKVLESVWGHMAGGGGGTPEDCEKVAEFVRTFLKGWI